MKFFKTSIFFFFFVVFFLPKLSFSAGFALIEQSVSGLGNAYAGGSANAEDASTIFYNPAGLTKIKNNQIIAAGYIIIPSAKFTNQGSTVVTGAPMTGGNGGDGGGVSFVPNFYYASRLTDKTVIGIGFTAPFGLTTEYDNDWVGRYHGVESHLMTLNIMPVIAYKITDKLSIGGGINMMYAKAKLTNAVDFGLIGLGPSQSQTADGFVELKGDNWAFGFNLGVLYELTENSRIGLSYRSKVKHKLKGDADFTIPSGLPIPVYTAFRDSTITAKLTTPADISLSFYHHLNPQWAIMADVKWTDWSVFDEIRIKFDSGLQDNVTTTNWRSSFRYSIGATYQPSKDWILRTGIALDKTPIRNETFRTPRIPCEDRIWIALGGSYQISKSTTIDVGYVHIFTDDPKIRKIATPTNEDRTRGSLIGTYDAHVDLFGVQVRYSF
ncbi:MAG: outer membrane protein transport protein [Thermodesulfovibrionales bacterium]|nr:outer membrane protein transport protein [Thermodesulfovibrionales bacterium]